MAPRISQLRQRHDQLLTNRLELETQLSDKKVELADAKTVFLYVDELCALLNESELVEMESSVRGFVKEVKVTGDEVVGTYTLPLLPKGVTSLPIMDIKLVILACTL